MKTFPCGQCNNGYKNDEPCGCDQDQCDFCLEDITPQEAESGQTELNTLCPDCLFEFHGDS